MSNLTPGDLPKQPTYTQPNIDNKTSQFPEITPPGKLQLILTGHVQIEGPKDPV